MAPRVLSYVLLVLALVVVGHGCGSSDIAILPEPAGIEGTLGTIQGTITSGGIPQAAAAISTIPASETTATDGTGVFTLSGVVPGRYTLVVAKPGFQVAFYDVFVVAGGTSRVDLDLLPATGSAILAGQVTDGAFGLELVRVDTVPATQSVITTADGRYQVSGPPGQYQVTARRLGYATETRVVQLLEGRTVALDFALGARADGVLSGQVTDNIGTPIPGARVDIFRGSESFTAFTDANGNYSFFNLTTDFYVVSAEAGGFLPTSKGLEVRGGASNDGDLVMYPASTMAPIPGSVTGTIADAFDRPVSGITVTISVASTPGSVVTSTDGRYTFVNVPAGSATITATQVIPPPGGPIYATGMRTIMVGSAQTADGSLNLEEI
jgi:hypothetical protein